MDLPVRAIRRAGAAELEDSILRYLSSQAILAAKSIDYDESLSVGGLLVMIPKQHTADNVCAALGLHGFCDPAWSAREYPVLRVLFFSTIPEICWTVEFGAAECSMSIVTALRRFDESLQQAALPCVEEGFVAGAVFPSDVHAQLEYLEAQAAMDRTRVICDGLLVQAVVSSRRGTKTIREFANPVFEAPNLIHDLLGLALERCKNPIVSAALAQIGSHMGTPRSWDIPPHGVTSKDLAILGDVEDKQELTRALRRTPRA